MKRNIQKALGFFFYFPSLFIIVYLQYTVFVESGVDIEIKGLIILIVLVFSLWKWLEHKKNVKEIQDKNVMFRVIYTGFKKLAICVGLYFLLQLIDGNIDDLVLTTQLATASFTLGLFFTILGNRKKK